MLRSCTQAAFTLSLNLIVGLAGKVSDEQLYALESKIRRYEQIIGAMSIEERTNPELIATLVSDLHPLSLSIHSRLPLLSKANP
jgi:hypothetical protein